MNRNLLHAKRQGLKPLKQVAIATGAALCFSSLAWAGQAARFSDGRVVFDRPPSLEDTSVTANDVGSTSAIYYFTLNLPDNAGEPLETVVIQQDTGNSPLGEIDFDPEDVEAFAGSRRQRGTALTLSNVDWNESNRSLTVTFDPPVNPGTAVTLRIEPERNPRRSGVYLFGVTAFPSGSDPQGQFLGYGRLHFYDRGDSFPFSIRHQRYR